MAEAAAIVGLVASIGSLIGLSAKVVSRLHKFNSKTSDIPESFRSLSIRLPLLTATLQLIQTQAESGRLADDVTKALKAVVDSTSEQTSAVRTFLSNILPTDGASKLERALKALKSLAKEDKIQQALERIHKNIDVLVFHQTTRHIDTGDRILEELSRLNMAPPASSRAFGVCLGQAPQIASDAFIGRTDELQQLQDWLSPTSHPNRQCVVSIVGMGGMGKTQLSLAHVRDCADNYSSVFWVNAIDKTSLRRSMADLSGVIYHESTTPAVQNADDEKVKIDQVRRWLSETENDKWLLIFDNYDDPKLPGNRSATGYDIRLFFPTRSQGSIIVTSRSTKLAFSKRLRLRKLEDINVSVAILSQRSGRDVLQDGSVLDLARRLSGLPLALATTGTYLGRADVSCGEYLEMYESAWTDLVGPDTEELLEYEARTMSSTWTISLNQVRSQNEDAAELLTFLAYLSHHDIWYDLIRAGSSDDLPWMQRVTASKVHFHQAMSKLHDYSLVDLVAGSYQVHPCLHDWLVESLNTPPNSVSFITALTCVAGSVEDESSSNYWETSRRLLEHAEELESKHFHELWQLHASNAKALDATHSIAGLLQEWNRFEKAEKMYIRTLAGKEKSLGPNHSSTLETVNNFGDLYCYQGKLDRAEKMYTRALAGREKAIGLDHPSTLDTVNSFGNLYLDQRRLDEAEQMYIRAFAMREKVLGPDHISTLTTIHKLGLLYRDQGKLKKAEDMCIRALAGKEKVIGLNHILTLHTFNNLAAIYDYQGKLAEAEQIYMQALAGYEQAVGPNHTFTLDPVYNLGALYQKQGRLAEAEQMYLRALTGQEKALGPDHISTLATLHNLGTLYNDEGKLDEAEQIYLRALTRKETVFGREHISTLKTINNLGVLYDNQGKLAEAEELYVRVLTGSERSVKPDHTLTFNSGLNLGNLFYN